jgi:hypothetical protein
MLQLALGRLQPQFDQLSQQALVLGVLLRLWSAAWPGNVRRPPGFQPALLDDQGRSEVAVECLRKALVAGLH